MCSREIQPAESNVALFLLTVFKLTCFCKEKPDRSEECVPHNAIQLPYNGAYQMKAGIRMAKNVFICCSRCKDIWLGSFETLPPVNGMQVFVCEAGMD